MQQRSECNWHVSLDDNELKADWQWHETRDRPKPHGLIFGGRAGGRLMSSPISSPVSIYVCIMLSIDGRNDNGNRLERAIRQQGIAKE